MANRSFHYGRDRGATELAMAAINAMTLSVSPDQQELINGIADEVEVEPEIDGRVVSVDADGTFVGSAAAYVTFKSRSGVSMSDEVTIDVRGRIVDGVAKVEGYVAHLDDFM